MVLTYFEQGNTTETSFRLRRTFEGIRLYHCSGQNVLHLDSLWIIFETVSLTRPTVVVKSINRP